MKRISLNSLLVHSSKDGTFVKQVVQKLERAHADVGLVVSVGTGEGAGYWLEKTKIDDEGLVVFFVSKASLATWKAFDYQIVKDCFSSPDDVACHCLVVIIDNDTCHADLPPWMQTMKTVVESDPHQIRRDIQWYRFAVKNPTLRSKWFVAHYESQKSSIHAS